MTHGALCGVGPEFDAVVPRLVLDSGALIALQKGSELVRDFLRRAANDEVSVVIPAVVLVEVLTGSGKVARVHRTLSDADVPPADLARAGRAGPLRARVGRGSAVDALVAIEALEEGGVVLTSDPDDISALVEGADHVKVVVV